MIVLSVQKITVPSRSEAHSEAERVALGAPLGDKASAEGGCGEPACCAKHDQGLGAAPVLSGLLSATPLGGYRKQFLRTRLVPVSALEKPYQFAGNELVFPPVGIEPLSNRRVGTPFNQMRAKPTDPFSLDVD